MAKIARDYLDMAWRSTLNADSIRRMTWEPSKEEIRFDDLCDKPKYKKITEKIETVSDKELENLAEKTKDPNIKFLVEYELTQRTNAQQKNHMRNIGRELH